MSTTPIVESANLGDLLKYEAPNLFSREQVTVAAGHSPVLGQVLGRDSTSGKFAPLDPSAADGTEQAAGVLSASVDATLIDREDAVAIVRHAIVASHAVVWPQGITAEQKATAIAELAALGVLLRQSA
jgi:hypothetical protein